MKKYLLLIMLGLVNLKAWADEYINETVFDRPTIFEMQSKERQEQFSTLIEEARDYNVMDNKLFENDKIKIYNHSLYEFDPSAHKILSGQQDDTNTAKNLKFSIGYGMEYKIDKYRKIGYEYVSNYPYDRGQMIRFFWLKEF